MSKALPQSTIDAALKTVNKTRKETELSVTGTRGVGTLLLRVRYTDKGASGSWCIRYTEGTKRPVVPLASYDREGAGGGIDRAEALRQFDDWARDAAKGRLYVRDSETKEFVTPAQARPVKPHETVDALVRKGYLEGWAKEHTARTSYNTIKACINCHLHHIGHMRAKDLKARDVQVVINLLQAQGHVAQADRFRTILKNTYEMAMQTSALGPNLYDRPKAMESFNITMSDIPVHLKKRLPGARKARPNAGMPFELLPRIYASADGLDVRGMPSKVPLNQERMAMLKLVMLFGGTRFAQIADIRRKDVNLLRREVTLRDYKVGNRDAEPHVYQFPIGPEALRLFTLLLPSLSDDGPLFHGENLTKPMSRVMAKAGAYHRAEIGGNYEPRDIRAAVSQWFVRMDVGIPEAVSDFIQSHGNSGLVTRHYVQPKYIRGSDFGNQVDAALAKLEDLMLGRWTAAQAPVEQDAAAAS